MIKREKQKKIVVVFGIFDGVHEGHRSLFSQAREHGDELVVIVGRDAICKKLKHKLPRLPEEERRALVEQESLVDQAVLGDKELSSYAVLEKLNPDAMCLGYDQQALHKDISSWAKAKGKKVSQFMLKPFRPDIYGNSLIHKR